jgi:long-chain fatty acid transport protein
MDYLSMLPTPLFINIFVVMRGYLFRSTGLCVLFSALAFSALAGGYEQPYQSARVMGLAGNGTGFRMGAASAFYNPAAMSFLEFNTVTLGAAFYTKKASYLSPYGGNTDQDNNIEVPLHIYGVYKLNDEKSAIGLSVNQPFGFQTQWPGDWTGRYQVVESSLSVWFIQPSFSYKFSENFSGGLGPVIGMGNRLYSRKINFTGLNGVESGQEFDGSGTGFGFAASLYYEVEEEFSIGLSYRSAITMKVSDGSVSFSDLPQTVAPLFPEDISFDSDLKTPAVISLGASYMPVRELLLTASLDYTGWAAVDGTNLKVEEAPEVGYNSNWDMDNTITFRVGAEYELNAKLSVRAGVALDASPVPDDRITPEFPDADRYTGALGLTVHFSETFYADLAFLVENTRELEVYNSDIEFGGTYKTIYNHFGFTVNFDF